MKRIFTTRKALSALACCIVLPLASAGCHNSQPATTQVAISQDANSAGSDVSSGASSAGHGVAQATRDTGHAIADGSREAGSSAVDIATNSFGKIRNRPPESLSAPVIDVDEAMQARDWDQSTALYKSGATVAGPIGFMYQPRAGQNAWRYQFIDLPLFLGNTMLIPVDFVKTPPWKPVEWKADTVEPTYTGVAPLPPQ
jgi:hypothetical protein